MSRRRTNSAIAKGLLLAIAMVGFFIATLAAFQYERWAYRDGTMVHSCTGEVETFTLVRERRWGWFPAKETLRLPIDAETFKRLEPRTYRSGSSALMIACFGDDTITRETRYTFGTDPRRRYKIPLKRQQAPPN